MGGPRRKSRFLITLVCSLLIAAMLGTIVNVAVAWACAVWINPKPLPTQPAGFRIDDSDLPTSDVRIGYGLQARAPGLRVNVRYTFLPGGPTFTLEDRRAWPLPGVRCWYEKNDTTWTVTHGVKTSLKPFPMEVGGEELNALERVIPWEPVWGPFLVDTGLYTAFFLCLFIAPGRVRLLMRIRCGRCRLCGYDLRGDVEAGCPECGWGRVTAGGDSHAG